MARIQNLTTSIADDLGSAIVVGKYTAKNPFPVESTLCEQFNASRPVLREAVKMLTAKGLLSARPRRGTRVEPEENWNLLDPDVLRWILERKFSLNLLLEFAEIRRAIEPAAAHLAARRGDALSIHEIGKAVERMKASEAGYDDALESDIAFHLSILRASDNRFYYQFQNLVKTALKISIRFTNKFKGVEVADAADHEKVYLAIKAGKPEEAKEAMEWLVLETLNLINSAIIKKP
jgi:DNA-binding FadR family transcriptional regulator